MPRTAEERAIHKAQIKLKREERLRIEEAKQLKRAKILQYENLEELLTLANSINSRLNKIEQTLGI